ARADGVPGGDRVSAGAGPVAEEGVGGTQELIECTVARRAHWAPSPHSASKTRVNARFRRGGVGEGGAVGHTPASPSRVSRSFVTTKACGTGRERSLQPPPSLSLPQLKRVYARP